MAKCRSMKGEKGMQRNNTTSEVSDVYRGRTWASAVALPSHAIHFACVESARAMLPRATDSVMSLVSVWDVDRSRFADSSRPEVEPGVARV